MIVLQEVGALSRRGERAGVVAAPDAVANAGDESVAQIADGAWSDTQQSTEEMPGLGQRSEQGDSGVGAKEDFFGRSAGIAHGDDGVGAGVGVECGETMAGKKRGDARRFGRNEAQAVIAVAAQEPADGAIAKAAVAVVEDEQARAQVGKSFFDILDHI